MFMREDIEKIAKALDVDTYSKKLKLNTHLDIMVAQAIACCTTLNEVSALTKVDKHLTPISSSQLSVVNRTRDYRIFVWIFSELLDQAVRKRHALKQICKELTLLGIDSTTIPLDLPFAEYGYHSLTKTIERGIKLHIGAVLGRWCGLAKTYGIPVPHGNYTRDMGKLTEKASSEVAQYAKSWNLIEASIGLAAINSMIPPRGKKGVNALDVIIEEGKNRKITMVGMFPRIEEIREVAKELWILEMDQRLIDTSRGILPSTASEFKIPESDLVVITGSTLVNKSMGRLLGLCREAYTIILGPSTPLSDVLFDYGADMLAGVEVTNPEELLRKISQSGGMVNTKMFRGR